MNVDTDTIAYLNAKELIDRRARNSQLWERLKVALKARHRLNPGQKLIVTEIGGGLGGLAETLLDDCTEVPLDYRIVEINPRLVAMARARLESHDFADHRITVLEEDVLNPELPSALGEADLVIAQSVLDQLDLRQAMPQITALAKSGGLLYAPVTFNGFTEFRPPYHDATVEYQLLTTYHRSIDERTGIHPDAGGSRAGWVLQRNMHRAGGVVLGTGSSDWLVSSDPVEPTHRDFLAQILDFYELYLHDREDVQPDQLRTWLVDRRRQMENGQLLVHIHNLDLLAQFPG